MKTGRVQTGILLVKDEASFPLSMPSPFRVEGQGGRVVFLESDACTRGHTYFQCSMQIGRMGHRLDKSRPFILECRKSFGTASNAKLVLESREATKAELQKQIDTLKQSWKSLEMDLDSVESQLERGWTEELQRKVNRLHAEAFSIQLEIKHASTPLERLEMILRDINADKENESGDDRAAKSLASAEPPQKKVKA